MKEATKSATSKVVSKTNLTLSLHRAGKGIVLDKEIIRLSLKFKFFAIVCA